MQYVRSGWDRGIYVSNGLRCELAAEAETNETKT
jgi:hypothetical protein